MNAPTHGSPDPLRRLGRLHGTDKAKPAHDFVRFYPTYLASRREEPLSFLEVGVFRGASLKMWNDYFTHPHARLNCIDNKRKHLANVPKDPRWTSFLGCQSDTDFLKKVCSQAGPFDVVIEDGQHVPSYQIACFETLWPHLKSGGVYVIEDIHTSFQDTFIDRHCPDDTGPRSVMPYLHRILDTLIAAEAPCETEYDFVHFYTHAVVIGKV